MSVGFRKNGWSLRVRLLLAALLALLILLALAALWMWWTRWAPAREDYPLQGVSVSADQGDIEWRSLRPQGIDFAYIRAVDGNKGRDSAFARNMEQAKRASMRYGVELVYAPCKTAAQQATIFMTTVPRDNAALPPAVRLDGTGDCADQTLTRDRIISELNTLINVIETHSGKPALLRLSADFEEKYAVSGAINRTLWLERDYWPPDYAQKPWVLWTANGDRRVSGINGPVEWTVVAP